MRRKILYLHHTPFFRGSATSLYLLIKELDRSKYDASMLLTEDGAARQAFEGIGLPVRICKVPMAWEAPSPPWWHPNRIRNRLAFTASPKFLRILEEIKPDLLHINDTCSISAAISAKKAGIPVVCHVRSVHRIQYPPAARLVKEIYRLSDRLIPISEEYALQFTEKEKLRIVYNSLDFKSIESASGAGQRIRHELGIPNEAVVVGMVGTLTAHKGAWDFIEAAAITLSQLGKIRTDLRFMIIGSIPTKRWFHHLGIPDEKSHATKLLKQKDLTEKFIITGHRKDIYQVMDALDLVVFPTRLDATGRPILEGSAMGKPVIATSHSKDTGVLIDGETGYITAPEKPIDLAKAMTQLITEPEIRKSMGQAGRENANKRFRPENNIAKVHEIYKQLLGYTI